MKHLLFIFLFYSLSVHTQNDDIFISLPESNRIYTGFDNLIKIGFTKSKTKDVTLECWECDKVKQVNQKNNSWVISASKTGSITLEVRSESGKKIGEKTMNVFEPPKPIVFLDSVNAEKTINKLPKNLSLQMLPSIPPKYSLFNSKLDCRN